MSAQQVGPRALEVVVCLQDSIVDVIHVRGEGVVRAGSAEGCEIPLPAGALGPGVESMVVARVAGTEVQVAEALTGTAPLVALTAPDAKLAIGPLRVFVRHVADAPAAPRKVFATEKRILGVIAASFAAHMAFLMVLTAIPPEAHGLAVDWTGAETNRLRATVKPPEDPRPEITSGEGQTVGEDGSATQPKDGKEGTMGVPGSVDKGKPQVKGTDKTVIGQGDPRANGRQAGVLRVLDRSSFSAVTDGVNETYGGDYADATGVDADGTGRGPGEWGGGWRNSGPGGCPAGAYCGPGTVGKKGFITGNDPDRDGTKRRPPGTRDGGERPPRPINWQADVKVLDEEGLDEAIVRREIMRHRAEIQYCYERELRVNPDLQGTVTVYFTIMQDGSVQPNVKVDSNVSDEVASCVRGRVKAFSFPSSNHRTHVKFPFRFSVSGR
jgi:hypothetical protein